MARIIRTTKGALRRFIKEEILKEGPGDLPMGWKREGEPGDTVDYYDSGRGDDRWQSSEISKSRQEADQRYMRAWHATGKALNTFRQERDRGVVPNKNPDYADNVTMAQREYAEAYRKLERIYDQAGPESGPGPKILSQFPFKHFVAPPERLHPSGGMRGAWKDVK